MTIHSASHTKPGSITVISGGVGAARFLRGLIDAVDAARITAVVNTGDDTVLHGLSISPDLDTITYTLAGAIDPERGWGLVDETWRSMEALGRYVSVRPDGSSAAPQWFNLGDQDLATHFYRTARLDEGATQRRSLKKFVEHGTFRSAWCQCLTTGARPSCRLSRTLTQEERNATCHSRTTSFASGTQFRCPVFDSMATQRYLQPPPPQSKAPRRS